MHDQKNSEEKSRQRRGRVIGVHAREERNYQKSRSRNVALHQSVVKPALGCPVIIRRNTSPIAVLDSFQVILAADRRQRRTCTHLLPFNLYTSRAHATTFRKVCFYAPATKATKSPVVKLHVKLNWLFTASLL